MECRSLETTVTPFWTPVDMGHTTDSIGLLEALSRSRELTQEESAELCRLVRQEQILAARRRRYRSDPAYREAIKISARVMRRGDAGRVALGLKEAAAMRARDAMGRFA